MGQCPCPRCFTGLSDIPHLGKASDTERRAETRKPTKGLFVAMRKARKSVFKGYKVSGSRVERLLGGGSRVPTNVWSSAIVPSPYTLTMASECLHGVSPRAQCIRSAHCRPTSRGRAWGVEGAVHPHHSYPFRTFLQQPQ
jgi:hypothetical protein